MATDPKIPEVEINDSVSARFEGIAGSWPTNAAIHSRGRAWSYSELNRQANRIAHALLSSSNDDHMPVVLLFEHHAPAVAAILGVLKAGKCYVCLDSTFPVNQNAAIIEQAGSGLLFCDAASLSVAANLARKNQYILIYEDLHSGLPSDNPGIQVSADMNLGVFFTTGSTGNPKGVLWRHDICLHRMHVDRLQNPVKPADNLTLLTPLAFPAATSDLLWALLNGACLCLYDVRMRGTGGLLSWLREREITCMRSPVALFRHFLDAIAIAYQLPKLRKIVLSGDTLYAHDIERMHALLPDCNEIIHRYSMSEAGLVCQMHLPVDARSDEEIVPAGFPVPGKSIRLVDLDGLPLPEDTSKHGEIAVSSRFLAAGYWRQPELTRSNFVEDPEIKGNTLYLSGDLGRIDSDGCLEILGRRDERLKIRGYRVETAAVVAALLELDTIKTAVVVPVPDVSGEKSLAAHIVPEQGIALDVPALHRHLSENLQDYMIPARFTFHDELPLTVNGKTDLQALSKPAHSIPDRPMHFHGPRGEIEERIAKIWLDELQLEHVGRNDDFFALGGHSLLAAKIVVRIDEAFQVSLPLKSFYQAPTVAGLASILDAGWEAHVFKEAEAKGLSRDRL